MKKLTKQIFLFLPLILSLNELGIYALSKAFKKTTHFNLLEEAFVEQTPPFGGFFSDKINTIATNEFDPFLLFKYIPGIERKDYPFPTDQYGFPLLHLSERNRDLDLPHKTYRIFILGASTVQGDDFEHSLPLAIENELRQMTKKGGEPFDYEIIMAAMGGYNSGQEAVQLITKLLYFSPQMVITYDGAVDSSAAVLLKNPGRNHHPRGDELKELLNESSKSTSKIFSFNKSALLEIIYQFYTVRLLFRPFQKFLGLKWPTEQVSKDEQYALKHLNQGSVDAIPNHLVLETYLQNLKTIHDIAIANGIVPLHILQPILPDEIVRRNFEVSQDTMALVQMPKGIPNISNLRATLMAFSSFTRQAAKFFNKKKVDQQSEWVDLTTTFQGDERDLTEIYIDRLHHKAPELVRIAKLIAPHVQKQRQRQRFKIIRNGFIFKTENK